MLAEKNKTELSPLAWDEQKQVVKLIDQRFLPYELKWIEIANPQEMAIAIKDMALRGAPLIGIAAAYGMALAAKLGEDFCETDKLLRNTRPTALNLMWALDQMQAVLSSASLDDKDQIYGKLLEKAKWIQADDLARCKAMGKVGAEYIKRRHCERQRSNPENAESKVVSGLLRRDDASPRNDGLRIMTICNAGALATAGYGTALGVIRSLYAEGLVEMVYANETRPRQQGSRLTCWELAHDGIPVTLNSDNMAGYLMQQGKIDLVIAGSDRIAANGDAANKIGTYSLAVLAQAHKIPFFIAAPHSTIDLNLKHGGEIPIEERDSIEVSHVNGRSITAEQGVDFVNPAFDVTPNELIEAIFTEEGLFEGK